MVDTLRVMRLVYIQTKDLDLEWTTIMGGQKALDVQGIRIILSTERRYIYTLKPPNFKGFETGEGNRL